MPRTALHALGIASLALLVVLGIIAYQQHAGVSESALLLRGRTLVQEAKAVKHQIHDRENVVKQRIKFLREELRRAKQKEHTVVQLAKQATESAPGPAATTAGSSQTSRTANAAQHAPRTTVAGHRDGAEAAFWKSLQAYWLLNPGANLPAFLAATRRWDGWFEKHNADKDAAVKAAVSVEHDKLPNDPKSSADTEVLARTQYLVAKYLFLEPRSNASLQDWRDRTKMWLGHVPRAVLPAKWKTATDRDALFSMNILRTVRGVGAAEQAQDKFRVHDHLVERSRRTYLQAMRAFFLERGDVNGGSESDRAMEEWIDAQHLWEAIEHQRYEEQEEEWRAGEEKKLRWEEKRLGELEHQHRDYLSTRQDATDAEREQQRQVGAQEAQVAEAKRSEEAWKHAQETHAQRQAREQASNARIAQEQREGVAGVDSTQHGFGVEDAAMGQLAGATKVREEQEQGEGEARAVFLRGFEQDMRRHRLRSTSEVLVRALWLQSLAEFADSERTLTAESGDSEVASSRSGEGDAGMEERTEGVGDLLHSERFGDMSPVERAWSEHRRLWQKLWAQETSMQAEQRAINVARGAVLACSDAAPAGAAGMSRRAGRERRRGRMVGQASSGAKRPRGRSRQGQTKEGRERRRGRMVGRAGAGGSASAKAASRLQSLYLMSDASPDEDMLEHSWREFTRRPPSRLPAFGMAQSDADLSRHAAAARRAVTRDCGSRADCAWMHSSDGLDGGAGGRGAGLVVSSGEHGEEALSRDDNGAAERAAVKEVLAKEVAFNQKEDGSIYPASANLKMEESELLWEVKAMIAQKQLVRQQVDKLIGGGERAHQVGQQVGKRQYLRQLVGKLIGWPSSSSSSLSTLRAGMSDTGSARAKSVLLKLQRALGPVAHAHTPSVRPHASAERSVAGKAQTRTLLRERRRLAREGWVVVDEFVAPWDPCSAGAAVAAEEAVRQHRSLCSDLSLIRDATRPAHTLSLMTLIQSRAPPFPVQTPEEGNGEEGTAGLGDGHGHGACGGAAGQREAMLRLNRRQAALNRRRLKLYIQVFGAVYKGESSSSMAPAVSDVDAAGASKHSLTESVLVLLGLAGSSSAPPRERVVRAGSGAISGDKHLEELLGHLARHKGDWARVEHDWDELGMAKPAMLRLSAGAHAVLASLHTHALLASLNPNHSLLSAHTARLESSVARTSARLERASAANRDARGSAHAAKVRSTLAEVRSTLTPKPGARRAVLGAEPAEASTLATVEEARGRRVAVEQALTEEEEALLRAEERILLERRAAEMRGGARS